MNGYFFKICVDGGEDNWFFVYCYSEFGGIDVNYVLVLSYFE